MNNRLFRVLIGFNVFTSALCFFTNLTVTTAYSYIFQNTIFIYSLYTGLFLMSMGLGVLLVQKFNIPQHLLIRILFINGVIIVLITNPTIFGLFWINEYLHYLYRTKCLDFLFVIFPLGLFLTTIIGIIAGSELPLFSKLIEAEGKEASRPLTAVLVSDYIGSFIGSMAFAFILFPSLGLIKSIFVVQVVMLVVLDLLFVYLKYYKRITAIIILSIINIYVIISFIFQDSVLNILDSISFK